MTFVLLIDHSFQFRFLSFLSFLLFTIRAKALPSGGAGKTDQNRLIKFLPKSKIWLLGKKTLGVPKRRSKGMKGLTEG